MLKPPEPKRFFDTVVRHIYANIILNTQCIKIVLTKPIKKEGSQVSLHVYADFYKN